MLGPRLGHAKDPGPWEGEQRNMWKPTQQEGLWFHGGNLHQSRHYSQFLALQLKARMRGHPDAGLRAAGGPSQELSESGGGAPGFAAVPFRPRMGPDTSKGLASEGG